MCSFEPSCGCKTDHSHIINNGRCVALVQGDKVNIHGVHRSVSPKHVDADSPLPGRSCPASPQMGSQERDRGYSDSLDAPAIDSETAPRKFLKCASRECLRPRGQIGHPRSMYCSKKCQCREQNLRQGRIKNARSISSLDVVEEDLSGSSTSCPPRSVGVTPEMSAHSALSQAVMKKEKEKEKEKAESATTSEEDYRLDHPSMSTSPKKRRGKDEALSQLSRKKMSKVSGHEQGDRGSIWCLLSEMPNDPGNHCNGPLHLPPVEGTPTSEPSGVYNEDLGFMSLLVAASRLQSIH